MQQRKQQQRSAGPGIVPGIVQQWAGAPACRPAGGGPGRPGFGRLVMQKGCKAATCLCFTGAAGAASVQLWPKRPGRPRGWALRRPHCLCCPSLSKLHTTYTVPRLAAAASLLAGMQPADDVCGTHTTMMSATPRPRWWPAWPAPRPPAAAGRGRCRQTHWACTRWPPRAPPPRTPS